MVVDHEFEEVDAMEDEIVEVDDGMTGDSIFYSNNWFTLYLDERVFDN